MPSKTAPYGTWNSPITADAIVQGSNPFAEMVVDPIDKIVYHVETRPSEAGRNVLVETKAGRDVVGSGWNVRTGVHEYGGASAIVHAGMVYFSHYEDARIYKIKASSSAKEEPKPVTPDSKKLHRFADFDLHPKDTQFLVAIKEDHTQDPDGETPSKVITTLCIVNVSSGTVAPLVTGADFYSSPRFSPDGSKIAWVQWDFPDMPWDGAQLQVADVVISGSELSLKNVVHVAGEHAKVSIEYPYWVSKDMLLFTSDQSGYQNPWKYVNGKASPVFLEPVSEDFCEPAWTFGLYPYAAIGSTGGRILCTAWRGGRTVLYLADVTKSGKPVEVECPYVAVTAMRGVSRDASEVVFYSPKLDEKATIVLCHIPDSATSPPTPQFTSLLPSESTTFPPGIIAQAQSLALKAPPNDRPLHAVFYPPTNPDYVGSSNPNEKPPCVVNVHGGPTGLTNQGLDWKKQYFTSRGWAWLDVNYGGSSGYGRKYISLLDGQWGILDIQDCITAARLISQAPYNLIDLKRITIRGGSAGGYTTLASMSISSEVDFFAAGTSSYGVSDLSKLAEHTHKFESRYLDKLLGSPDVYKERSPAFHADKIVSPLLILQGEIDRVVPKEQAEAMVKTIEEHGGIVEYKLYKGEGHGWRQEAHIKDALERELDFYTRQLHVKA
ncbi:hypothetical protein HGRIS_010952 [Hohenbuehelia grisea]|uniref:Peptidase S9 prolyl oligopeptidase catalytic domain-containing protein n=1 Tax=Hohenbuehelia grisea TaxID=104357 RepID=A0ABR3IZ50_9AGAR